MAKYRNEWKYICSDWDLKLLESRLSGVLEKDKHAGKSGGYSVRSLYFDDYSDTCIKQNAAGLPERFKWRIRYYGGGGSKFIHLEYKRKTNGRGIKKSCKLTKDECETYPRRNRIAIMGHIRTATAKILRRNPKSEVRTEDYHRLRPYRFRRTIHKHSHYDG